MRAISRTSLPPNRKQIRHFFALCQILGLFLAGLGSLSLIACRAEPPPAQRNFGLERVELKIEHHRLLAEVADTPEISARGLMFRDELAEDAGMLFIFPAPRKASFYMKNTRIPLSIAYILADGTIAEIHDLEPLDESPVPSQSDQILYALEMNQGWFAAHDIEPGTRIEGIPPR